MILNSSFEQLVEGNNYIVLGKDHSQIALERVNQNDCFDPSSMYRCPFVEALEYSFSTHSPMGAFG